MTMAILIDDQGKVYEVEDTSALTKPETITVYDESGEPFLLNRKQAEECQLNDEKVAEAITALARQYAALLNRYRRAFPEAAFARAPEAAFARAPEAAFARAPEAAFARAPEAPCTRPPEAYIYYPATGLYYRVS
jgi:hypothetical protein